MDKAELTDIIWEESICGMALVDSKGVIKDANPKLCEILGYSRIGLIDKTIKDITHPDDYVDEAKELSQLYAGEIDRYGMWKRYITKDGHVVGLWLKASAVKKDGNLQIILSQVTDILPAFLPVFPGEAKKEAKRVVADFLVENWKTIGIFILIITGISNIPEIVKMFM